MKHIHRSHLIPLGTDSNPAQFARQGNPWDGDGRFTRKAARKGRRKVRNNPPRLLERASRDESEAMLHLQCKAALAAKLKADSGTSRTTVPSNPPRLTPTVQLLKPARAEELGEWDRTRIEGEISRLERQAKAARIAAKEKLGDYRAAALADLDVLAL